MSEETCGLLCMDLRQAEVVRAGLPSARNSQLLAEAARACADPTRVRVAAALAASEELCVCDLAWIVGASPTLVSHHLSVLRRAGLVTSHRAGKLVMSRLTDHGAAFLALINTTTPAADEDRRSAPNRLTVRG